MISKMNQRIRQMETVETEDRLVVTPPPQSGQSATCLSERRRGRRRKHKWHNKNRENPLERRRERSKERRRGGGDEQRVCILCRLVPSPAKIEKQSPRDARRTTRSLADTEQANACTQSSKGSMTKRKQTRWNINGDRWIG